MSKQDELAAVMRAAVIERYSVDISELDPEWAAELALTWMDEQFDHQLYIAVAQAIHGNTIGDRAKGEPLVRERRLTDDILRDASAAFAAVRQHLGLEGR